MKDRIYLWGDSIGKGVVYSEERGRYVIAREGCVKRLRAAGLDVESHAVMGGTIVDGYRDFMATEVEPGGVCVIEYGGNDCDLDWQAVSDHPDRFHDGRTPLPEFRAMLELFVASARERGLQPMLVLPPPLEAGRYYAWVSRGRDAGAILRYLGDVARIDRWHERWTAALMETALRTGAPVIDLRSPFLDARDFPSLICLDGIHPNAAGQELMARKVFEDLRTGAIPA